MNYNPDVLTCLANLSNDEVFTPPDIANQMLDTLPQELFSNPNAKFLDPFSKSGVFLREIAKRLLKGLEAQIPDLQERIDHIMHRQLYGIGITELTAYLSRRSLYCSTRANGKHSVTHFENENGNIYFKELPHSWDRKGKCTYCGATQKEFGEDQRKGLSTHAYNFIHNDNPFENMQFDVIIGNPPYQLNVGSNESIDSKAKKQLTEEEIEYKNRRKQIQEKLIKFATRIPIFMYLSEHREQTLHDVITLLEPELFKKVTGITVKDFELLSRLGLFNSALMNDAVLKFKHYEDASLAYTGKPTYEGLRFVGAFDTIVPAKEYVER